MPSLTPDVSIKWLLPAIGLFLLFPVAVVFYYVLLQLNTYFGVLQSNAGILSDVRVSASALFQAIAFALGMVVSAVFYSFRFRFLIPALLLVGGLYLGYGLLQNIAVGEFDSFFLSVAFLSYGALFLLGWIIGWGFVRWRYWHMLIAALFLVAGVFTIARFAEKTTEDFIRQAVPLILTAVYLVFMGEQIYRQEYTGAAFWKMAFRRLGVFGLILALISLIAVPLFKPKITEVIATTGGTNSKGEKQKGMVKQEKDGTMRLNNATGLQSSFKRSNELVFAAHIDNYFPQTAFPNPLYLTSFYYSRFDPETETFERDSMIPESDLFQPDWGSVPLFRTYTDSAIYRLQARHKLMHEIEIEVYSKRLSKTNFVAPHIGYSVQPITVEPDFREEFSAAYRAKSLSSELNSAYFVYNVTMEKNPEIVQFQEDRFAVLRDEIKTPLAPDFRKYYTTVPADPKWNPIKELAGELSAGKKTTIDKVLAVRDYFTQKDAAGKPLFQYSDNPGIPDIPSASRLLYFLFENRKGYCAYYAGATLFLLRAMGIPSRIAVGYMTVDRSGGKNGGWYWYYADQAHAWVQVYFPGYGWLDFDTTVGNSEAEESPQPDGTPPMQPPKAILAVDGIVERVDTISGKIALRTTGLSYKDQQLSVSPNLPATLDASKAPIQRDTVRLTLKDIHPEDTLTAVAYQDLFKVENPPNAAGFIAQAPKPLPVEDVYVKPKVAVQKEAPAQKPALSKLPSWVKWAAAISGILTLLLAFWLLLPRILLNYLKGKISGNTGDKEKAYWAARAVRYRLALQGIEAFGSFDAFARHAEAALKAPDFPKFSNVYQKVRFSPNPLTEAESATVLNFYPAVEAIIQQRFSPKEIRRAMLRPAKAVGMFWAQQPEGA